MQSMNNLQESGQGLCVDTTFTWTDWGKRQ